MIPIGQFPLKIINTEPKKPTLKVGEQKDWKFGLISRNVTRVKEDLYEIDDCSDGWVSASVNHETFEKLTSGEISLSSLNWE